MNTPCVSLEERIRASLIGLPVSERHMFGGVTFLLNGNMLCCASKKGLMVRVGKDAEPQALANPTAKRCDGAGRPMPGFISIEPAGISQDDALEDWLQMALAYVGTLPAKSEESKIKPQLYKEKQMKKFMFLHYGFEKPTPEIMKAWQAWFESISDKQVEQGGFAGGREISKNGTRDLPWNMESITGYNIIEAENLDAAEKLAQSNPFISSIRIYELR